MSPEERNTKLVLTHKLTDVLASDARIPRRRMAAGASLLATTFPHDVIVVLDGALAVEVSLADGEVQILEVVGPQAGMLRGRSLVVADGSSLLRALVPTTIVRLPEAELNRLLEADGRLACSLADQLCDRAAELRERLLARNTRDARRRVAHSLLYLLDKIGLACSLAPGHRLPLSQATIAAAAGVARQTVNRALRDLQALGLIHIEREMLCVLDRSALKTVAQGGRLKHARAPAGGCAFVNPATPLVCHPPKFIPVTQVSLALRRFVEK